ncbi:uncharacterized protein LOC129589686 [Paramacrobiotus metropolitanus]|uniref:uncharacterized protein LOC129589686 n=1 Tax=Paramacrobiotus metropolitanus TaxID=2943436 RepID=UPI0024460D9E|nr:uncharacterized protein LOC129589686 [Paramacrobiotus metropolitanus]
MNLNVLFVILSMFLVFVGRADSAHRTDTNTSPLVTREIFQKAIEKAGYGMSTYQQYKPLVVTAQSKAKISSMRELAMFIANVLQGTDGLWTTDGTSWSGAPDPAHPNRDYHARGYLMMRGFPLYKEVSKGLYGDDRLVKNPALVTKNPAAWDTAYWIWANKVHNRPGIAEGKFGVSRKILSDDRDCGSNAVDRDHATESFQFYSALLSVFEPTSKPDKSGC